MIRVSVFVDDEEPRVLTFEGVDRVTFGRALRNGIVLPHNYVSRDHGEFLCENGVWSVVDQGSQAGLLVRDSNGAETKVRGGSAMSLAGGEDVVIVGTRIHVDLKPEDATRRRDPPTRRISRLAETQIAQVDQLQKNLVKDSRQLESILELARDLNREGGQHDVLVRIGQAVFESLRNATHFIICVPGPSGLFAPSFGVQRDGREIPLDEISVSQSILEMVVERETAMLFQLADGEFAASHSMIVNAITSSMAVLLRGSRGNVGVLLVENRAFGDPFSQADLDLILVLANSAAFALERAQLHAEIEHMFEGFVDASVTAIEARDPTTSGHSRRVAALSVALAEVVDRTADGELADCQFPIEKLTSLTYAGLLHDFGKVGVAECVLVKPKRLYPEQLTAITSRFRLIREAHENSLLRAVLRGSGEALAPAEAMGRIEEQLAPFQRELEEAFALIYCMNSGEEAFSPERVERLEALAQRTFRDATGRTERFLTREEVAALSIESGTLTEEQRQEIEAHVTHSVRVLNQIPWPETLTDVPEIVHAHHEKLDGKGYPRGLRAEEIPLEARILAVCDIFDAVTASDRPYRSAMTVEAGIDLLRTGASNGEIDKTLVELFIAASVWKKRPSDRRLAELLGRASHPS